MNFTRNGSGTPETNEEQQAEHGTATDGDTENEESADGGLSFDGTVQFGTTKEELWGFVSEPENLVQCVPGADDVEQLSQRRYTFDITRGVSRLTLSVSGEAELVEMHEPDWIVADGNAYDATTGSQFDVVAAMELSETDDGTVDMAYTVDIDLTGGVAGVAGLTDGLVRSIVKSDMETYFENIRAEVESPEAA
ncbi:carbon monoxide dehydrogenase subunit G-like protein [Halalkaliarchaeum desulfuricum]|uniref:Carbon monoxide dehydrogenase subunit G-like protein n=1 Tax=Halalkaliarchaeum desulfuricum TaxID=2055893 RepID=A0A343THJ9_9EURY|nr:SRPBCC domain-containing protein [Halalkaliarchaeum desulfuricum]AUX08571.1 carbon monoxide dehydrogenase subunit G-like protein [Halalkaliarchaeum desulfuricum]